MTPKAIQYFLASVFVVLGGWCLISPSSVLALTVTPQYQSDAPIIPFFIGCFGAQALISGLFAAFARFTKTTFLAYGVSLLAFFVFDWWFYVVDPVFTAVGLLDAVGNVIMLVLCIIGYRKAERT